MQAPYVEWRWVTLEETRQLGMSSAMTAALELAVPKLVEIAAPPLAVRRDLRATSREPALRLAHLVDDPLRRPSPCAARARTPASRSIRESSASKATPFGTEARSDASTESHSSGTE